MSCRYPVIALAVFALPALCLSAQQRQAKPAAEPAGSLGEQIAVIKKEQQGREKKFNVDLAGAKDNKKLTELNDKHWAEVVAAARKIKSLIKANPKDPDVVTGVMVLQGVFNYYLEEEILQILRQHHWSNPRLGQICFNLRHTTYQGTDKFLEDVAAHHPDRGTRAYAAYALAEFKRPHPGQADMRAADAERAFAEARRWYTEVSGKYADVRTPDGSARLGGMAALELARIRNVPNLVVGKPAPEITGEDIDGKAFKLSDYRGKVVVLDFWGDW